MAEKVPFQRRRSRPALLRCKRMNLSSRKARQQLQMWNCRYRKHPEGLQSRRNRRLEIRQWDNTGSEEESTEMKMTVQVGESTFTATLEDNAAVDALVEMMEHGPVTIQMSDYAGFEKVGALGTSLPTSNSQTTTQAGDIVLYQGNQIVMFYGSNSWSYTRLGTIDDLTSWTEALGSGDVSVTFSLGG